MIKSKERSLKKHLLLYGTTLFSMLWLLSTTVTSFASEPSSLTILVDEAMSQNLEISSLAEKAHALRLEAPFAGSLPDPKVSLSLSNIPTNSFDFSQEAMTQKQIAFSQQMPWFGTLDIKEQKAELMAEEQEAMVQAKRLEITRQIKDSWYQLGFTEQSLKVNARLTALMSQILQIAENRYATGKGLQQDILLAQVQLSELLDQQIALNSQKRQLQDRIGSLLNRESSFSEEPEDIKLPSNITESGEILSSIALQKNPLLAARRIRVTAAEYDIELAEKDYMPNMDFRLTYGQREDDPTTGRDRSDFVSAGITFSIPLWQQTRQDSIYDSSKKRFSSAKKSLRSLETALPHTIDGLLTSIHESYNSHQLFSKAITIQTSQLADSSLASYSVGKVDFASMMSARIRLLKVELQIEQYKYRLYQKMAELEETVGQPLNDYKEQK